MVINHGFTEQTYNDIPEDVQIRVVASNPRESMYGIFTYIDP